MNNVFHYSKYLHFIRKVQIDFNRSNNQKTLLQIEKVTVKKKIIHNKIR